MTTSPICIYQVELTRKSAYEAFLERVCELTEYFDDIENIIKRRRDMRRDRPVHLGEFVCAHLSANSPVWVRYETLEAANVDLRTRVDVAQVATRSCCCGLLLLWPTQQLL